MKKECYCLSLGNVNYTRALKLQKLLYEKVIAGKEDNYLILLEHNPVITIGRSGKRENLLVSEEYLKDAGIEIHSVERGGDITYHGPGQIVGYPILDLREEKDIHLFVRRVEEVMIRVLAHYDIKGERIKGLTGVWVGNKKIGAIGMAVRKWVSFHGFAFNVNPDMSHFDLITPCGIKDKGVTSLSALLGNALPSIDEIRKSIVESFADVFTLSMKYADSAMININGETLD
ncbi:MAG: lipoyl(octanoyl) transferase LipB [Candidatus Schekmanbacteria bacterium]|nr:lipoyl(octanoyl) transferase LipB [Candidatus Schekmanbacteria bacterium]